MVGSQLATDRATNSAGFPREAAFIPIALDDPNGTASMRLCVMLREERRRCYPIVRRQAPDAQLFLGGLVDQAGRVHRWLEIHVQFVDELSRLPAARRAELTNTSLDDRWQRDAERIARVQPGDVISTRWEHEHPSPMLLDIKQRALITPTEEDGRAWQLCRDDNLLHEHGLPSYSASLHRYLVLCGDRDALRFIPLTADAPENEHTLPHSHLWRDRPALVPFNVSCGLLFVRSFDPVTYESYIDHLSDAAKPLECDTFGGVMPLDKRTNVTEHSLRSEPKDASHSVPGRLFISQHARAGRLLETLHLKLRVFHHAVRLVRDLAGESSDAPHVSPGTSYAQLPACLRVRLGPGDTALPRLWLARTVLAGIPSFAGETGRHEGSEGAMRNSAGGITSPLHGSTTAHAIAVLAVRTLLVNDRAALSKQVEAAAKFARRIAKHHDPDVGLTLRVLGELDRRPHWRDDIGPQMLTAEPLTADEARAMVPDSIWHHVLAMIVRALPGMGPDSICRDADAVRSVSSSESEVPGEATQNAEPGTQTFRILDDCEHLLLETRNLMICDWQANREIHEVIGRLRGR